MDHMLLLVSRACGDDEDDARRCRSDARARTRAALAAAERLRVTVDADGAVIAREREKAFPLRPFLSLTKMEAAISLVLVLRSLYVDDDVVQ